MEIFRSNETEHFIEAALDIADIKTRGPVSEQSVSAVLQSVCMAPEEKTKVKTFVREIFQRALLDGRGCLGKKAFVEEYFRHAGLFTSVKENLKAIKSVDKRIENDLEEHFQIWIPISSNIVKYKEGIHFPIVSELLKIVRENEDLKSVARAKKQRFVEYARRHGHNDFSDDYEEDENC